METCFEPDQSEKFIRGAGGSGALMRRQTVCRWKKVECSSRLEGVVE